MPLMGGADMVMVSYMELIGEHDLIDERSEKILDAVEDASADPSMLAVLVDDLAVLVEAHVAKEAGFISELGQSRLVGEWIVEWKRGLADFDALCGDWQAFLDHWSRDRIAGDRAAFAAAAQDVLGRLRTRVQDETAILYSTALQTGAIGLR